MSLCLRVGLGHGLATTNLINAIQYFATPGGRDFFIRISWNRIEKCLAKTTAVLF